MKKQNNETKNEQTNTKQKRVRKEHLFFLYADGKGFVCAGNDGIPTVGGDLPLSFTERKMAMFAMKFFKQIKLADDIALFAKIA
ncbi:MAG: hypothetical protein IJ658_04690 [Kiritimatiellae bacterium]|nr:hypothetical protein [Kiritimatiellia bacterium]